MLTDLTDILRALREAEAYLVSRGVPNARRNADWILAHVLECGSTELYLTPYRLLDRAQMDTFSSLIRRRGEREPLQYILGSTEFMSLPFRMRTGVFIPRPDTEVVVEHAEALLSQRGAERRRRNGNRNPVVLDLCCGAGVIGISLVRRLPQIECVAVDIDPNAVALTRENAGLNGVGGRIRCVQADALEFLRAEQHAFDAVLCNPPYVPTQDIERLLPEVKDHEPVLGLDGGMDGLSFFRDLVPLLGGVTASDGIVALEIGDTQAEEVSRLVTSAGFARVAVHKDYRGLDRVVIARKL